MHRRSFLAATLATGACTLPGCTKPDLESTQIKRFARPRHARDAEHAVVYRNENEFCGWPFSQGFFEAGDGTLLCSFIRTQVNYGDAASLNHDVVMNGNTQLVTVRSRDQGSTWDGDAPQIVGGSPTGEHDGLGEDIIADLGPVDFMDGNTLVWSQCSTFGTPNSRPYVRISKDAGRNWSRFYRLPLDGQPAISSNSSQLVRPDGRSLIFLTAITDNGWSRRPMVYLSTADRSTWRFMAFITPREDSFGAADGNWANLVPSPTFAGHRWFHPRGLELPNGRILCTLSCQRSPQESWSELHYSDDGGATWGFRSRISDFGAPTSLVRMRDDRLVAVYGYRMAPYGVRAAVSNDEGRTWEPEIVVRDDGGSWDLGYPQAVESTRGKVMAIYYFNSKDDTVKADGGVRHIARTIFTPD